MTACWCRLTQPENSRRKKVSEGDRSMSKLVRETAAVQEVSDERAGGSDWIPAESLHITPTAAPARPGKRGRASGRPARPSGGRRNLDKARGPYKKTQPTGRGRSRHSGICRGRLSSRHLDVAAA